MENEELYYYLTVKYEDYPTFKEYNYISEDTTVVAGDRVLVDMAGYLAVAEVVETGYYNKSDAPFPIDKTKRIIKKVDKDFELDNIEYDEDEDEKEFANTVTFVIDDTFIDIGINNYVAGEDNDEHWTNVRLKVENQYFDYLKKAELLTSAEVEWLLKELVALLNDELKQKKKINFYEPDIEFVLYPKLNLWDTGEYVYIKEGHEIQDIYINLNIYLTDRSGVYTGQKYVLVFDREEIEEIVEYLKNIVEK